MSHQKSLTSLLEPYYRIPKHLSNTVYFAAVAVLLLFLLLLLFGYFFSSLVTPKHHLISCPKRCQNEPPEIPNVQHQSTCPCCCCCSATLESFPRTVVVFLVVHNLSSLTRSPLPSAGVGGYYNCMCAVYT